MVLALLEHDGAARTFGRAAMLRVGEVEAPDVALDVADYRPFEGKPLAPEDAPVAEDPDVEALSCRLPGPAGPERGSWFCLSFQEPCGRFRRFPNPAVFRVPGSGCVRSLPTRRRPVLFSSSNERFVKFLFLQACG